jgi:hypothetical protein
VIGIAAAANSPASAATVVSAVSATASSTFGSYNIIDTINQSGLSAGYVSGVTDFDSYVAANPIHSALATGREWFTVYNDSIPNVTYDLGTVRNIDRLMLWNEEYSGFGTGTLSYSTNGVAYTFLQTINPVDSPANQDYGAQIFTVALTAMRYLRIELSGCPQPDGDPGLYCGIGEVAFAASSSPVPVPAALPLFASGLGLIAFFARKRKTATTA